MGGARCLGRQDDIGSIEVGKLADLVLWRLDGLGHDGIDDRVAALVFGPPAPVELALVGGSPVVERGELVNADARDPGPAGPPGPPPPDQGRPMTAERSRRPRNDEPVTRTVDNGVGDAARCGRTAR